MNQQAQATATPYEQIGGEAGVRALVRRFYQLMDVLPEAYGIRRLDPPDLAGPEDKLFMFLSGWLGGPPLFASRYGHPRLRARHLPFAIGRAERDQWLMCMNMALEDVVAEAALRHALYQAFVKMADHMRNRPEPGGGHA